MAWRIDSETILSGEGVATFAASLYERDEDLMGWGQTVYGAASAAVVDTWTDLITFYYLIPTFQRTGDIMVVGVQARGETNDQVRLYDKTATAAGTAVDVSGSSDAIYDCPYTSTGDWAGTVRLFAIQGYQDGAPSATALAAHFEQLMSNVYWESGG